MLYKLRALFTSVPTFINSNQKTIICYSTVTKKAQNTYLLWKQSRHVCYTVLTKPVELVRIHNGGRKRRGWRQQEPKRTGSVFLSCGGRDQDSESSAPAPGAISARRRPLTVPGGCALTVVPRFRKRESPQSRASSALLLPNSARAPSRQGDGSSSVQLPWGLAW